MAEELERKHGRSPARTFQLAVTVCDKQKIYGASSKEEREDCKREMEKFQAILKKIIESYGGIEVIDNWLIAHDTHQLLNGIKDMDWDFLSK
ncbi:MAG: hypothetical protein HZA34_03380 [Candidatus Pacebacteria bacterium]|nr:hypothetical protein [Candidatus Paceibacterota bacterium]